MTAPTTPRPPARAFTTRFTAAGSTAPRTAPSRARRGEDSSQP